MSNYAECSAVFYLPGVSIQINDLVEVGRGPQQGIEGIVVHVEGNTALVQPVDSNTLEANGHCFNIHTHLLTTQPSPTDIRREKVRLRQQHLANLPERTGARPHNLRVMSTRLARRQKPISS